MKFIGNLSLCLAVLLLLAPMIPNQAALRTAILRLNHGPIGSIYALLFWLTPRFLRRILASLALWNLLFVALAAVVWFGGFDWIGVSRLFQCLLVGAACFAMTEISVLIGLTKGDSDFQLPDVVRVISPWAGWVLPLVVLGFAVLAINPRLLPALSPWVTRLPLVATFFVAIPIGAVLFVRWITPPKPVVQPNQ